MRYALIISLTVLLFIGCKDDEAGPKKEADSSPNQVLLINEGNFQWGNATMGSYNPSTGVYTDKVFQQSNEIPIGDVLNQVIKIDGDYWCVVNNSGKIYILDSATRTIKHTITGFTSPRYACDAGYGKVYITDLYENAVYVVSKTTKSIDKKIAFPGWSELMLLAGDRMYVSNNDNRWLYLINPASDVVEDSIEVGSTVNSMLRANNATVLVLCDGKQEIDELAALYIIDPKTRQKADNGKREYPAGVDRPYHLRMHFESKRIFNLQGNSIVEMDNSTYESKVSHSLDDGTYYAFDISPSGKMYVGNAKNYVDKSVISVYDLDFGEIKTSFTGGINTNSFVFE